MEKLVSDVVELVRHGTTLEIAELVGRSAARAGRRKRLLPCIAPACKNLSKGPRFHYLCDDHRKAPKKDWEAWQEAAKDKRKEEKRAAAEGA